MTVSSRTSTDSAVIPEEVTVLLVDDDEHWAWATGELLEREGDFDVELAHSLAAGRERFAELDPDCVVSDYQLGDGDGLELLATVHEADPDRPFVLVTGRGDESVASEAIGRGVTDYVRKGEDDAGEVLASKVATGVHTYRTDRALQRQRRTKTAVLDVLRDTASEAALCRQFCRRLVEDDAYAMAWIGTAEPDGTIRPRTSAGHDDYLDAVTTTDGLQEGEPVRRVNLENETVVVSDLDGKAASAEWARVARNCGFESVIATPIQYEGVQSGALGVYLSSTPPDPDEARVVEEYAETVGYALRSLDRKRSLLADQSVRVEVTVSDPGVPLLALAGTLPGTPRIECPSVVGRTDGSTVYLCHFDGHSPEAVATAATDVSTVTVDDVDVSDGSVRCAVVAEPPTPEEVLGSQGVRFERTIVEDGTATVRGRVGEEQPVSGFRSALEREFEGVSVQTIWTDDDSDLVTTHPFDDLTDKQREYLRHAFHEGYFDRPRGANGTEIAERLGIARQTFTQHLRTAQRKVVDRLLDEWHSG
ncbi:helix-turn-helix domain-containing protein [Halostella salina]|uniref:helix-turn-helix domain-containing protein n=1 Tax=Halostella salina TaxID=1547897 RepID=UPI0013CE420F|nr:helix-turn-helix domain-containing protein [Halostella salina]